MAAWTRAVDVVGTPVVADGRLLVSTPVGIEALDPSSGNLLWTAPVVNGPLTSLVVLGERAAGILPSGVVVTFSLATGDVLWRRQVGPSSRHTLAGEAERYFVATEDGRLVALAAVDGSVLWEQLLPATPTTPMAAEGRVFIGSSDNAFYAFDGRTGSLQWRWRTGGDVVGADVGHGRVYFAALDNRLRAVDRDSGNQRWQVPLQTRPAQPPAVVGSVVVMTGVAPEVSAFDAATGAPIGSYLAPAELRGPALLDPEPEPYAISLAIITRDGQVIGLRSTGLQLAEPPLAELQALPGRDLLAE